MLEEWLCYTFTYSVIHVTYRVLRVHCVCSWCNSLCSAQSVSCMHPTTHFHLHYALEKSKLEKRIAILIQRPSLSIVCLMKTNSSLRFLFTPSVRDIWRSFLLWWSSYLIFLDDAYSRRLCSRKISRASSVVPSRRVLGSKRFRIPHMVRKRRYRACNVKTVPTEISTGTYQSLLGVCGVLKEWIRNSELTSASTRCDWILYASAAISDVSVISFNFKDSLP
jgi:hypothetical protein